MWFALIATRGMTLDKLRLPRSSRFFALQVIWTEDNIHTQILVVLIPCNNL